MLDYRIPLVEYIKHVLKDSSPDYPVFDGAMTFKQDDNNYCSYFIVNEEDKSLKNYGDPIYDKAKDMFHVEHKPLVRVDILIDLRGTTSFQDSRTLYRSFKDPTYREYLLDKGLGYFGASGVSSLPHLKEDYQEEGYIFTLHLTYNAKYLTDINVIEKVKLQHAYAYKCIDKGV